MVNNRIAKVLERLKEKEVFIFGGEVGCGKTEVAINFSLHLMEFSSQEINLIDLDIIKPYWRIRELRDYLSNLGIKVITSSLLYCDVAGVSPEIFSIFRKDSISVIDLGGDEVGGRVLGMVNSQLKDKKTEFFLIVNFSRPFSRNVEEVIHFGRNLEKLSVLPLTGIINNTHLLWETDIDTIKKSINLARKVSNQLNIPIIFHTIKENLPYEDLHLPEPVLYLKLFVEQWVKRSIGV